MPTFNDTLLEELKAHSYLVQGTEISFDQFYRHDLALAEKYAVDYTTNLLLDCLLVEGLKLSMTSTGYRVSRTDEPSLRSPPQQFSFSGTPFVERPKPTTGEAFLPLLRRDLLKRYFVHQIRWFPHPTRPRVMMPLRFYSHRLTEDHPSSRMYVDVPVVFQSDIVNIQTVRISLTVFESILFSMSDDTGAFITLRRKKNKSGIQTEIIKHEATLTEEYIDYLWNEKYLPNHNKARPFLIEQTDAYKTALAVADHLIGQRKGESNAVH